MARWTYLAADLRRNVILGELPLTGVKMSKVLNGAGQLTGDFALGDPRLLISNMYDMTRPARRAVYAYRDDRPWWGGIIWASDYDSATSRGSIACADFASYFDHRKVLEVLTLPAAATYIAGFSKIYTQVDQNDIARGLVTLAQSHTAGDLGIVVDSTLSGILRDRTYEGFDLKDVGAALRDLSGLVDGCDILFDVAGLDANGRPIRIMRTGDPYLSAPGAAWRWDLGGNMLSYVWTSGGGVMATREFAQGTGTERGSIIAVSEDTSRYDDGWPLLETDDIYATVSDFTTLQGHADSQQSSLGLPVVTPLMRVRGDIAPELDFSVGDFGIMGIPAGDLLFRSGLDLDIRVISTTVALSPEGQESIDISCQPVQEVA